ncbi:MAG: peptide chain release factor N(5)-glutamine methyltransferase [Gammaproteobacteria bacterium]|nr:peptide chain release factor N(5)-glutamine methyltransferase [Gammaproteobacteria bacterium]
MSASLPPVLPSDTQPRPVQAPEGLAPGVVADWLAWAATELAAYSDSPRADAETLLAELLGSERSQFRLRHDDVLEAATVLRFASWIERRRNGEPVAYIVGRQGFWTLDLAVDTAVLIPRPDTETLVEWALALLPADRASRVLDLGTGSGAIALALAAERSAARLLATDLSDAALDVARENARRHDIGTVDFRRGAWFQALAPDDGPFDLIVSNPPYIAEGDAHLAALRYEPRLALTAGVDGLDALREIVRDAPRYLAAGGWLLLEHGHDQGDAVQRLLDAAGFAAIESRRDFGGNVRVTGGSWR